MSPRTSVRKPHVARHAFSTVGLSLFTVFIISAFVGTAFFIREAIQSGQLASVIATTLIDLTNENREYDELGTLAYSETLTQAAQAKAHDMAEKGYFAHTSPDGIDPWFWFNEAGYTFSYAGENLAINFADSADVEQAWMESPGHRANILNEKFTEIGIATAVGEYEGKRTVFVVQLFGTPRTVASLPPSYTPVQQPSAQVREERLTTQPSPEATVLVEAVSSDDGVVENTPAPTVAGVETEAEIAATSPHRYTSWWDALLSSPETLLRALYGACALVILIALALTTRLEFQKHHIRHMIAVVLLFILMGLLFLIADWYLFVDPHVGETVVLYTY